MLVVVFQENKRGRNVLDCFEEEHPWVYVFFELVSVQHGHTAAIQDQGLNVQGQHKNKKNVG